jgi:hypothetical protein
MAAPHKRAGRAPGQEPPSPRARRRLRLKCRPAAQILATRFSFRAPDVALRVTLNRLHVAVVRKLHSFCQSVLEKFPLRGNMSRRTITIDASTTLLHRAVRIRLRHPPLWNEHGLHRLAAIEPASHCDGFWIIRRRSRRPARGRWCRTRAARGTRSPYVRRLRSPARSPGASQYFVGEGCARAPTR